MFALLIAVMSPATSPFAMVTAWAELPRMSRATPIDEYVRLFDTMVAFWLTMPSLLSPTNVKQGKFLTGAARRRWRFNTFQPARAVAATTIDCRGTIAPWLATLHRNLCAVSNSIPFGQTMNQWHSDDRVRGDL